MTSPAATGSRARAFVTRVWPLLALAGLTVGIVVWARYTIFPAYSWNRDEPVYAWHASVLRSGALAAPDGFAPEFFRPWLSAARDGELFSQYTMGWPLVLVAGELAFGSPTAALAFGAVLAVLGTYAFARELTGDRGLALTAGMLMALSPIIPIQGGVYLGYLFTLGLGLLFATLALAGVRRVSPTRLVGAGLLLGWIFLTRPFDGVLWGAAVAGYLAWSNRRAWARLRRPAFWSAAGALPVVALTVWCNRRLTGRFTEFPITVADPLDKFGFGERRIMPGLDTVDYGIVFALKGTAKNGAVLPLFLAGAYVGLAVALLGLWRRRRDPTTVALAALIAIFPLGYFAFWGTTVSSYTSRISGPIYFVPLYAPLCILMASVVVDVFRRHRRAGAGLAAVLILSGLPFAIDRLAVSRAISEAQRPWRAAAEAIESFDDPSLVFVGESGRYLLFLDPYSANAPDLGGRVLYATDRGGHNLELIERYPERAVYREEASLHADDLGPREHPNTPKVRLTPLSVVHGEAVTLEARVENTSGEPAVVAVLEIDGRRERLVVATDSQRGDLYTLRWTLIRDTPRPSSSGPSSSGTTDLDAERDNVRTLGKEFGSVTVRVGFGGSAEDVVASSRQVLAYRIVGSTVQVLVPARAARLVDINGLDRWRPTFELAELAVEASP